MKTNVLVKPVAINVLYKQDGVLCEIGTAGEEIVENRTRWIAYLPAYDSSR